MQPSELEKLPFYEYIELRKRLQDYLKKQEDHNEEAKKSTSTSSLNKQPKTPKFKMPSFKVPKF